MKLGNVAWWVALRTMDAVSGSQDLPGGGRRGWMWVRIDDSWFSEILLWWCRSAGVSSGCGHSKICSFSVELNPYAWGVTWRDGKERGWREIGAFLSSEITWGVDGGGRLWDGKWSLAVGCSVRNTVVHRSLRWSKASDTSAMSSVLSCLLTHIMPTIREKSQQHAANTNTPGTGHGSH